MYLRPCRFLSSILDCCSWLFPVCNLLVRACLSVSFTHSLVTCSNIVEEMVPWSSSQWNLQPPAPPRVPGERRHTGWPHYLPPPPPPKYPVVPSDFQVWPDTPILHQHLKMGELMQLTTSRAGASPGASGPPGVRAQTGLSLPSNDGRRTRRRTRARARTGDIHSEGPRSRARARHAQ